MYRIFVVEEDRTIAREVCRLAESWGMEAKSAEDLRNVAAEAAELLKMLLATDAGTGLMHESFDPDAPEKFTRDWFAWANSMFGEMIYRLYDEGRLENVMKRM